MNVYHQAIGEELNATVAEVGSGEFEVSEVAGEGASNVGHEVVEDVNEDGGSGEGEEEVEFDPCGGEDALGPGQGGVREDLFETGISRVMMMMR